MIHFQPWDWFWFGLWIGTLLAYWSARAQYFNGANDGYGYAVDPNCPGHWKAGRYLRKHLKHRWPEVMQGAICDPDSGEYLPSRAIGDAVDREIEAMQAQRRRKVVNLTPEQKAKALEFDRENWRRWAAREITTDEADRYMAELQSQSDAATKPAESTNSGDYKHG
jgi:hypothetical protein